MHIISNPIINRRFGAENLHILFQGCVQLNVKMTFSLFTPRLISIIILYLRSSTIAWTHHLTHSLSLRTIPIGQFDQFITRIDNQGRNFFHYFRSLLNFSNFGFINFDSFLNLRRINKKTHLTLNIGIIQGIHFFQPT